MAGVLALPRVAQATNAYLRRLRRERLIDQAVRAMLSRPVGLVAFVRKGQVSRTFAACVRHEFARLAAEAYR